MIPPLFSLKLSGIYRFGVVLRYKNQKGRIMTKIHVFRDSEELHAVSGALVDFLTTGYFERDGLKVHCLIGYIDISDHTPILSASTLVIPDQLLEDGTQIDSETINLFTTDDYEVESIKKEVLTYE